VSGRRLLLISNQVAREAGSAQGIEQPADAHPPEDWWGAIASTDWYAGFAQTFSELIGSGHLAAFDRVYPRVTAATRGHDAANAELAQVGEELRPDVVLIITPGALRHDSAWVGRFLESCGNPTVLYYENDPWGGWAKRVNQTMAAWFAAADVVFTTAREPHRSLFRRHGARDVRFSPQTYCQVTLADAEATQPEPGERPAYDAVMIGNRLARWGRVSRMPGAVARARLVRGLQRRPDLRLALYGRGWKGRGVKGPIPYIRQAAAVREGLVSVNWDHFPRHESYSSDRLPISLLAGRAHVTTAHPRMDWLPGEEIGLFQEPTPSAVIGRVERLQAGDAGEVIELGLAGHRWVRDRLSHRQAALFMLGAVDRSLLATLPEHPWHPLVQEWPRETVPLRTGSGE
jgi:hypothetical protein